MNIKLADRREELYSLVKGYSSYTTINRYSEGYMYRPPGSYVSGKFIYFYEWSNPDSTPLKFYTVDAFEGFLKAHDMKLEVWEREVIMRMIYDSHICCRKNCKSFVIASSQTQLKHVLTYGGLVLGGK